MQELLGDYLQGSNIMRKIILSLLLLLPTFCLAQQKDINRKTSSSNYIDYTTKIGGFWGAVEFGTGVNIHVTHKYKSSFPTEILLTGGYRYNKFFHAGLGFGARYYLGGNDRVYYKEGQSIQNIRWAFPLFANFRGLLIDNLSRTTVPYWSANIGYTINDGFYFAPSLGLRIGSMERNHLIVSLGYSLQRTYAPAEGGDASNKSVVLNAATLKIGYQF